MAVSEAVRYGRRLWGRGQGRPDEAGVAPDEAGDADIHPGMVTMPR